MHAGPKDGHRRATQFRAELGGRNHVHVFSGWRNREMGRWLESRQRNDGGAIAFPGAQHVGGVLEELLEASPKFRRNGNDWDRRSSGGNRTSLRILQAPLNSSKEELVGFEYRIKDGMLLNAVSVAVEAERRPSNRFIAARSGGRMNGRSRGTGSCGGRRNRRWRRGNRLAGKMNRDRRRSGLRGRHRPRDG